MEIEVYGENKEEKTFVNILLGQCLKIVNYEHNLQNVDDLDKIHHLPRITDEKLINLLNKKYIIYGIIPKLLVSDPKKEIYFKTTISEDRFEKLKKLPILEASKFISEINTIVSWCVNYFKLIEDNIYEINSVESFLIDKQKLYRTHQIDCYLKEFKKFIKIREIISFIKNDLCQDFHYIYLNLINLKYRTLISSEDIEEIYETFNRLKNQFQLNSVQYIFNFGKYELKIIEGSFDIKSLLDMLYSRINNVDSDDIKITQY